MAFNANFTEARLDKDDSLLIKGQSQPPEGATQILVSLAHGKLLQSALVEDPLQPLWTARFAAAGGAGFRPGQEVFVSGMALRPDGRDPLVWQGGFTIKSLDEK
jgi:hypothetical protein